MCIRDRLHRLSRDEIDGEAGGGAPVAFVRFVYTLDCQENQAEQREVIDLEEGEHCSDECWDPTKAVSYTHLRAHETVLDLVCRLLLEKQKHKKKK